MDWIVTRHEARASDLMESMAARPGRKLYSAAEQMVVNNTIQLSALFIRNSAGFFRTTPSRSVPVCPDQSGRHIRSS
jgi:hypothetical protein